MTPPKPPRPVRLERTAQVHERDVGIYEEYRCQRCGVIHRVAVR